MGHPVGSGSGPSGGYSGEFQVFQGCSEGVTGVFRDVSGLFRVFPRDFYFYFQIPVQLVQGNIRK